MLPIISAPVAAQGEGVAVVTVSGETGISDVEDQIGESAIAGVYFGNGGDVWKLEKATFTLIDTATDWVRPKSAAPGLYEIKCTLNSGALDGASAATGTWLALTSDRQWYSSQSSPGTQSANVTIEIREDGGAVIDSAVYSWSATWQPA